MNTKRLARKTITGGVAAALLLGGFAYAPQAKPAYAAEVQQTAASSSIIASYLRNLATYTSWVADKDEEYVRSDLYSGKNLVQASGLGAGELKDQLINNFNWYVDNASTSNLTSEEVQQLREEGARQISEAIVVPGYQPELKNANVNFDAVIKQRLNIIASDTAAIANEDYENLTSKLDSGYSLVYASGIDRATLYEALVTLMNQSIDNAVGQLPIDAEKVQKAKADAASLISEAIATAGGYHQASQQPQSNVGLDAIVNNRLALIISDAATIADKNYSDVIADLQSGKTLPQAVGLTQADLSTKLNDTIQQEINTAADQNAIDADLVAKAKSEAGLKISEILSTAGYTGKVTEQANNISSQLDARLKGIVSDAATIADKENYEIQDMIDQGASLATATGISSMELFERLMSPVNQYIDGLSPDADVVAAAKAKAADQVRTWVEFGYNN
ncbi:hypothetical protein [Paenibacillus sp. RC67]|uniref:hypothetical protein n=1 Tax=Paenibacillus sp. RC67 TaxID=3039392 RepID=UPI0024ADB3F1|nr:hypothetical protein [Paenibacillus sp. RC67]